MKKEAPMWEQVDKTCGGFLQDLLTEKLVKFNLLEGQTVDSEDFRCKVTEINELIRRIVGDQDDLYDQYRFHMFYHNGKFTAVRGEEMDTNPNFKKNYEL